MIWIRIRLGWRLLTIKMEHTPIGIVKTVNDILKMKMEILNIVIKDGSFRKIIQLHIMTKLILLAQNTEIKSTGNVKNARNTIRILNFPL